MHATPFVPIYRRMNPHLSESYYGGLGCTAASVRAQNSAHVREDYWSIENKLYLFMVYII